MAERTSLDALEAMKAHFAVPEVQQCYYVTGLLTLAEEVGKVGQHFGGARRAEADRIGQAVVFGHTVVGQARWQVEHVARFQGPLVGLLEVGQDTQVGVLDQRAVAVAHLADLPVALALALQQEHVVVVEVRAHAATRGGEADHHIVDAPAWQKAKALQQLAHFRHELAEMRQRIHGMRKQMVELLAQYGAQQDFSFVGRQCGMFSYSGLTVEQVARLKGEHAIYAPDIVENLLGRLAPCTLR